MEKINANVKMVMMTVNEIKRKCKHDPANRCVTADAEKAVENGFTSADSAKAKTRIAKCRRAIADGWSICCPMVVHKVGDEMFITDGQGRFEAALSENDRYILAGKEPKFVKIPVLLIERSTKEEMRADIRSMNTANTNWNPSDHLHCEAVAKGGETAERYETLCRYQDELGLTTNYIPRLILFGDHGRSRREIVNVQIRENAEFIKDMFKMFYESQDTRNSVRLRNKVRRVDVAMALNSIIIHIINACGADKPEVFMEVVCTAIHKLGRALSRLNSDEYLRLMGSHSFYVGSTFSDMISSRNRDPYITKAMANFRAAKFGKLTDVA